MIEITHHCRITDFYTVQIDDLEIDILLADVYPKCMRIEMCPPQFEQLIADNEPLILQAIERYHSSVVSN